MVSISTAKDVELQMNPRAGGNFARVFEDSRFCDLAKRGQVKFINLNAVSNSEFASALVRVESNHGKANTAAFYEQVLQTLFGRQVELVMLSTAKSYEHIKTGQGVIAIRFGYIECS
jgi:hypothetical protein